MRAVRFHEHGGPEVLKYEDAPEPLVASDRRLAAKFETFAIHPRDFAGLACP